jgi:CheY-like chemotaxis protein
MARILVIDDDPDVRAVLDGSLTALGYQVAEADSVASGVKACSHAQIDVIISDLFMPEVDGLEGMARFKREFPKIPMIAMSGNPRTGTAMLALAQRLGAAAILEKPFEVEHLRTVVARVLSACEAKGSKAENQ